MVTGTDSIKANEIAFAGITSVAAGTATTDEVTGLTGEDWSFDGSEGVVNNGITFTGVEFLIAQSAGLVGSDNGDTYTLESDGDVVVGDFTFQSLTHVNAGEGSDVLLGTSSADSFSLNSDGDVTSYGIVFSGLENVDAGDGDDELDASGKALHLTGNNYEVEDNDNNLTFSAIENVFVEVLYGTTGTDTFDVTGNNKLDANEIQFSGLQVVYSNGGNDFLFAKNTDSNSGKINKITFEGEFIKNVETVNLSDGVDTIEILSGGRIRVNDQEEFTTLFVNALGGDDTVIGYDSEDWTITASGDAQCIGITFTNVEMLVAVNAGLIAPENYDNFSLVASDVNPFAINIATANLTIEGANFVESSAGTGLLNANILGDTGVSLTANANEIDAGGLLFSGIDKVHAQSLTATDTATSFTAGGAAGSLTVSVPAGSDIDFFDLTRVTAGTGTDSLAAGAEVDLLSDAGEFFSNGINYFGIDSVDVASTHAVNGSGAAETFTLTANNAFDITLAGGREISFSNVSNVHAGGGYDTLDTSGNVILNGNTREARSAEIDFTGIDGTTNGVMVVSNNGDDFEVTGADTINANGIDFSGITSVTAGTGSDKATGLSGENWSLDALGNPQNNGIVFTNVEEFHAQNAGLDGSANADTFVLQGTGAVSYGGHSFKNLASVDGGGGDDTLDTSGSGLGVTLSGSDYQLSAGDIDFFNIEYAITAALTGSAGADTFTVTGAKTLDAWLIHFSGVDTVTAAGGDLLVTDAVALSGADNQVVAHEITVTGISDVTAASLEGTGGNDSFEIRGDKQLKANQINFAGVDSVDALGGSGDSVTGLSGSTWKLGTMENNNIAFTGVESVNTNRGILLGTAGVDTFTLEASGGVRVDTVTFSDLSLVNGVGGSDVLDASAFAAGLALSGSDNRLTAQGLDLTFANIFSATTATLAGTAGVDEFAVDALDSLRAGEIAFSGVSEINAGDGADLLRVAGDGRSFDVTGSRSLSLGPIDVSGLERLEYSGTGGTATGATGIDWSLEATPGEVENSLITFAGVQTLVADGAGLFGTAAAENYGLQDDSDVVIHGLIFQSLTGVDAGGGSDTITLASSAAATLTGTDGEAEIRGLNFSHIEAVANGTLAASGNGDRYVVTGANAVKANEIAFSGITSIAAGSGSDSVTGDGTDWTLTANNDELTNRGITFTGVERVAASGAGLYGPDTAEQYALSDSGIEVEGVTFTGLAFVDAGIAADQLDATGYMGQLALTGNSKQLDAGGLLIRNMDTIIADSLTGSSGADSFDVAADGSVAVADLLFTSGLGAIDAGDGDDSIAVASDITLAGQNGAVAAAGIDFTHIENASGTNIIVVGTAGDESFALQGSKKILTYGITIDGVAGVEALGGVNRIVGTAGADTFAVSGNNALTTAGIDFSGISAVSAGGGSDRLQGTAGADNFELAASGDIGVAGINFRGLETVAAGAGSDSVTANGASWTSLGSGGALVDGSALATVNSVTVVFEDLEQVDNAGAYQGQDIDSEYAINSLDSLTVAGVTFAGLNSFTAGSGFDVLRGADIDAQWSLSASQGTISSGDESLLFSGVESIVAGSGSDHFTLAGGTFTAIDTGAGNDTVLFAGTALDSLSLGDGNDLLQVDVDSSQDVLVYGGGGDDEFQFNVAGETWQIFDSASRVGNFQFSGFEWLDNNTGSLTLETDLGFDFVNGGDNSASFNRNGAGILFADGVRLGYDGSGDIAITSSSTETIGGDLQADRANLTVAGNVDITSDVQVLNIQTAGADIDISVVAQGDLVIDEINAGGGTITLNSAKFGSLTAETYGDTHLTAGKVTLGTELQQWSVIGSAINPLRMDVSNSVDIVSISYFEPDFVGQVPTLTAKGDELQSVAGAQAAQGLKSAVQNAVEDFAQVDPGIFSAVNPYSTGVDAVNSPEMQLTGDQLLPLTVSGAPEEDELPRRSAELEGEDGDLQHQSPREGDQAALATEEVGG
ncbi:beta strand repeat-containing protein [Microbulbifer donghaiensis]|uniref:beta strand repeat-containing protein n=1 Tax=Microbulbifer donghaiensis TaxID=494016 RepID=UPI000A6A6812|nr:hypothetical protein [Microbulbifer donghaiensis]